MKDTFKYKDTGKLKVRGWKKNMTVSRVTGGTRRGRASWHGEARLTGATWSVWWQGSLGGGRVWAGECYSWDLDVPKDPCIEGLVPIPSCYWKVVSVGLLKGRGHWGSALKGDVGTLAPSASVFVSQLL